MQYNFSGRNRIRDSESAKRYHFRARSGILINVISDLISQDVDDRR